MGMADGNGPALPAGDGEQTPVLTTRLGLPRGGVEKDMPAGAGHPTLGRHPFGHAQGGGATVDEVIAARSENVHEPVHGPGVAGEQAAHVVVDPAGMGDAGQVAPDLGLELRFVLSQQEGAGAERARAFRLHGQVHHDLVPTGRSALGQASRIGGARQDGAGHRRGQGEDLFAQGPGIAQIVDDDGNTRSARGQGRQQQAAAEQESASHPWVSHRAGRGWPGP